MLFIYQCSLLCILGEISQDSAADSSKLSTCLVFLSWFWKLCEDHPKKRKQWAQLHKTPFLSQLHEEKLVLWVPKKNKRWLASKLVNNNQSCYFQLYINPAQPNIALHQTQNAGRTCTDWPSASPPLLRVLGSHSTGPPKRWAENPALQDLQKRCWCLTTPWDVCWEFPLVVSMVTLQSLSVLSCEVVLSPGVL